MVDKAQKSSEQQESPNQNEELVVDQVNQDEELAEEAQQEQPVEQTEATAKEALLQTALKEQEEKVLRILAEMDNLRKRAERDVQHAHKFGVERLVQALLPVLDSFESARTNADQAVDEESGLGMIEQQLLKVLSGHGVTVIEPAKGDVFDAEQHQALTVVPGQDMEPNCVVEVVQRGFQLSGRLVRAANVLVSG